jgi:hypothetical protein
MKKFFLVITAALLFCACTAPPTNRDVTSTTNTNKPAETKTVPAPVTEAEVTAKEKEMWANLEKKDYTAFAALLADDFLYVTGDGAHDKADTVKSVTGLVVSNVVTSDWKFIPVGKSAAVVTFTVKADATMNGEKLPPMHSHESSVWVNRGGKLVAVYHQDVNAVAAPAPPPAAKSAASPASSASAPAVMSSDVQANERAVWAALGAKQWDTFASYLATDFVETESTGVFDKAGSVKGVSTIDFSKSTLSGFKTVKIDDDSALVTYIATDQTMQPGTWYHSTVWSTRDGKWLAVFHQGTPQPPPPPVQKSSK